MSTVQVSEFELVLTRANSPSKKAPRKRAGELFLKGPVPMSWIYRAGRLPGHALHVGVVLWM